LAESNTQDSIKTSKHGFFRYFYLTLAAVLFFYYNPGQGRSGVIRNLGMDLTDFYRDLFGMAILVIIGMLCRDTN